MASPLFSETDFLDEFELSFFEMSEFNISLPFGKLSEFDMSFIEMSEFNVSFVARFKSGFPLVARSKFGLPLVEVPDFGLSVCEVSMLGLAFGEFSNLSFSVLKYEFPKKLANYFWFETFLSMINKL